LLERGPVSGPLIPNGPPKATSLIADTLQIKLSGMNTLPKWSEPKLFVSNTLVLQGEGCLACRGKAGSGETHNSIILNILQIISFVFKILQNEEPLSDLVGIFYEK
jgi:hypothetical protein